LISGSWIIGEAEDEGGMAAMDSPLALTSKSQRAEKKEQMGVWRKPLLPRAHQAAEKIAIVMPSWITPIRELAIGGTLSGECASAFHWRARLDSRCGGAGPHNRRPF